MVHEPHRQEDREKPMAGANEDIVRRGYKAFGEGDMETLASLMTDDVSHVMPGDNRFTGEHKGKDAVFAFYGGLFEESGGTYQAELLSIEEKGDDTVVSKHRGTGERGGQKLDNTEILTFTIKNGKITKIVSSYDNLEDEKAEDAFWGKG
jgi:ketosteroid isomerase-like protein